MNGFTPVSFTAGQGFDWCMPIVPEALRRVKLLPMPRRNFVTPRGHMYRKCRCDQCTSAAGMCAQSGV
jgi:hypothetical protein